MPIEFKYKPLQWVRFKLLDCDARIIRCIYDGGPMLIYSVHFVMNGRCEQIEFYEDEIAGSL